jgi:hypothetical protein
MEVPPLVEIDSGHFVRSFYSLAEEPVGSAP